MIEEKYQELLKDDSVIKFNDFCKGHFVNDDLGIEVLFIFNHTGYYPNQIDFTQGKRIYLHAYNPMNLKFDIPFKKKIDDKLLILVNSEDPKYAMTFQLSIDSENRSASVILDQYPQSGEAIITEEEKKGIEVFF